MGKGGNHPHTAHPDPGSPELVGFPYYPQKECVMDKTKLVGFALVLGLGGLAALVIVNSPDFSKAPKPAAKTAPSGSYLDSRSGPELERTIKRAVGMAGYTCGSVRSTERSPGKVYANCGLDGNYLITESGDDIRVMKE